MKDLCFLDVAGIVNAYTRQYDKERTIIKCSNLLKYVYNKGMLINNPFDENANLIINTIIRESNLTDLGTLYFDVLTEKWFVYTDKNDDKVDRINNIAMLDKYYDKLVKDYESKK
jgi:hypothetical protein